MLSRSSSDALRLRRSRSSSSFPRSSNGIPIEYIDPEVAQQQAYAAALAAYEQAHGPSTRSHAEDINAWRNRRNTKSSEGSHLLGRRKSSKRISTATIASKGTAEVLLPSRGQDMSTTGASAAGTSSTKPAQLRKSASGIHTNSVSEANSGMPTLPQRSIRKAQSSVDFSDTSANAHRQERLRAYVQSQQSVEYEPHDHVLKEDPKRVASPEGQGSIKRVFSSFIGQSPKPIAPNQENALGTTEKIVRKRTSFMSVPLSSSRRGKTTMHEPMQTTTTSITRYDGLDKAVVRTSTESHLPRYNISQVPKSRTSSMGLRNMFTKLFRKPSDPKQPPLLPQQQVVATRAHFSNTWESPPITYGSPVPRWPDHSAIEATQLRSRTPSVDLKRHYTQVTTRSRESSGNSQHALTHTGSRVTSWTDSTAARTITDGHNKRLSVIDEYGLSQQKSNADQSGPQTNPSPEPVATSLLGRRIYEKLIQRQHEAEATAEYEDLLDTTLVDTEDARLGVVLKPNPAHVAPLEREEYAKPIQRPRKSSWNLKAAREAALSTIRAVTPSITTSRKSSGRQDDVAFNNDDITIPIDPLPKLDQGRNKERTHRPTREQIAQRVARSENRWRGPLEANAPSYAPISGIDFATATAQVMPSATLRALRSNPPPAGTRESLDREVETLFRPVEKASPRGDCHGAVSPSVYSRATDGSPTKSIPSESSQVEERGSVVVLSNYRISSGSPEKRRSQHRPTQPSRSSHDWRAWLSKELGEWDRDENNEHHVELGLDLIRVKEEKKPEDRSYLKVIDKEAEIDQPERSRMFTLAKTSGHHREHAQITEDDRIDNGINFGCRESLGDGEGTTRNSTNDTIAKTEGRAKNSEPKPLVERPPSRMNERFPLIDTGRPLSRGSWQRPASTASDRRDSMNSKYSIDRKKDDLTPPERETAASRASAGNLLTVPENPLLAGRPKSMIPLRARTSTHANNYREQPGLIRPEERTPSPNISIPATVHHDTECLISSEPVTPIIAVSPYTPAKSPARLSVTPKIKPPSPFAAASSKSRSSYSTQDLQLRTASNSNVGANRTTSYGRPESVQSLRRKPVPPRPELLEDTTIRKISEGPYAGVSKETIHSYSKENVSSTTPRNLRTKRSFGTPTGNSPSGGQKMADEWLKRRAMGTSYGVAAVDGGDWKSEATGSPAFL